MPERAVFVVGSINQDLMVSTPRYPELGETVHGHDLVASAGGKGSNQAVAAARMGAPTHMVGLVGADAHGAAMRQALEEAGVQTASVETTPDAPTGVAVVTHTDAGQNAIIVIGGANDEVDSARVSTALAHLSRGDVLVTQLEIPPAVVRDALEIARSRGATTILNAAPAANVDELLPYVDLLVVNEFEAATAAGRDAATDRDARAAAASIAARHGVTVILTLGEEGSVVVDGATHLDIAPYPVEPVDSTGAGDTFVGALAAFVALGYPVDRACDWASAAGAHACLHVGAQAGAPTQQDLADRFGVGPMFKETP